MVEVVWTVVGLLAVMVIGMFVALFQLGFQQRARLDQGFAQVNARIDAQAERTERGFAQVNARIDAQAERTERGFAQVNARIDSLAGLLQAHIERHPS